MPEPFRPYQTPEHLFLRAAADHLAGRPVEPRRLVRWYWQWLRRYRFEPGTVEATAMLELALDPGRRPYQLEMKRS